MQCKKCCARPDCLFVEDDESLTCESCHTVKNVDPYFQDIYVQCPMCKPHVTWIRGFIYKKTGQKVVNFDFCEGHRVASSEAFKPVQSLNLLKVSPGMFGLHPGNWFWGF